MERARESRWESVATRSRACICSARNCESTISSSGPPSAIASDRDSNELEAEEVEYADWDRKRAGACARTRRTPAARLDLVLPVAGGAVGTGGTGVEPESVAVQEDDVGSSESRRESSIR